MNGITIHQFTSNLIGELSGLYPEHEIRHLSRLMLEHVLQVSSTHLLMMSSEELSCRQLKDLEGIIKRLKQHEPIQYIIGKTEFYGLELGVNPSVLIPRPETEELVEWILKDCGEGVESVLDIGTGSGCIALSLKAGLPDTDITAWDISAKALKTAADNAESLSLRVQFTQIDVLNYQARNEKYSCIVSNPPYVRELEKKMMEENVLHHEPHTALFVSDSDPLIFYRTIALLGKQILNPNGLLYFEINEFLEKEMTEMLIQTGYSNVECRKDISGRARMMTAELM